MLSGIYEELLAELFCFYTFALVYFCSFFKFFYRYVY